MEYVDAKGKVYEVSYSQKLQKEQNKILRQKNMLLFALLLFIMMFSVAGVYLYIRLETIDFLSKTMAALIAISA